MSKSTTPELQLQEINLQDEPKKKRETKASQVKQLQELTKQVLSSKTNDIQLKQSIDYIKQKINYTSKTSSSSYDGDQSFRDGMKCVFLDEFDSNYSSVSTVASIDGHRSSPKHKYQQTIYISNDENSSHNNSENAHYFLELWNLFKQIYVEEKTLQQECMKQSIKQMNKIQDNNNKDEEKDDESSYEFSIFSCFQCFRKKLLPTNLQIEKNIILYIYNTKKIQKDNNSNLLQKINRFYSAVNLRASKILQCEIAADNLNVLSNLLLVAFYDFHFEIFSILFDIYQRAPIANGQEKVPIAKIASAVTSDIIYLLSSSKIDTQIMHRQSVINYVNVLFFSIMFCYFQECVRSDNDFGEVTSKMILTALLKQTNSKPDSIINYFTKRYPSFIMDKNFLKYI